MCSREVADTSRRGDFVSPTRTQRNEGPRRRRGLSYVKVRLPEDENCGKNEVASSVTRGDSVGGKGESVRCGWALRRRVFRDGRCRARVAAAGVRAGPAPATATTTPAETTTAATTARRRPPRRQQPKAPTAEPAAAPTEPGAPDDAQPSRRSSRRCPARPARSGERAGGERTHRRAAKRARRPRARLHRARRLQASRRRTRTRSQARAGCPGRRATALLAAPATQAPRSPQPAASAADYRSGDRSGRGGSRPSSRRRRQSTTANAESGRAGRVDRQLPAAGRRVADLVAARGRGGRRGGPRHPRVRRVVGKPLVQRTCTRPTAPRAALAALQAGPRGRRPARHAHLLRPDRRCGRQSPGRLPGSRSGGSKRVLPRNRRLPRSTPLRRYDQPSRSAIPARGSQRRLQRRGRIDVVVAPVRARGSALAGAAAVPIRPLAPAQHASARRDRRSSHRSTRIALQRRQKRRPGWEDPRPVVSRVKERADVLEERMEDR